MADPLQLSDRTIPTAGARRSAAAFAILCWVFCCGGFATTIDPYDRYNDSRIGTYRGQFCIYRRTSVAGATPPPLERQAGPILPVITIHGMESNLAAYTLVAVPIWPLFLAVVWPALVWMWRSWPTQLLVRWHRRGGDRRGFDPIIAERDDDQSPGGKGRS